MSTVCNHTGCRNVTRHPAQRCHHHRAMSAVTGGATTPVPAPMLSAQTTTHKAVPGPRYAHVLGSDIPAETSTPGEQPYAVSEYDHPNRYPEDSEEGVRVRGARYTLRLVSLDDLVGGFEPHCDEGRHGSHCYSGDNYERTGPGSHDVEQPFFEDEATEDEVSRGPKGYWNGEPYYRDDADYVSRLAEDAQSLPCLLVPYGSTGFNGGGHRTAAWRDAGMTHVPCWVPD